MRLLNARQAWHDAYHANIKSTTTFGIEALQLGITVQRTLKNLSNYYAIHQWIAGKIQHQISLLPAPLQSFWHYLYLPMMTKQDKNIAHELIWAILKTKLHLPENEQQKAYWLIRPVIKNYRQLITNSTNKLTTPKKIMQLMEQEYGIDFDRKTWRKHWQPIYNNALFICKELDKQALAPITKLIEDMKQETTSS